MSGCECGSKTRIMYACSGAADVGEVADKVARKLRAEGFAKLTCLAAIGANLSGYVESAKGADENITIDGCPVACAKKNLERLGLMPKSIILTEMGLIKGQTPSSDKVVDETAKNIIEKLGGSGRC